MHMSQIHIFHYYFNFGVANLIVFLLLSYPDLLACQRRTLVNAITFQLINLSHVSHQEDGLHLQCREVTHSTFIHAHSLLFDLDGRQTDKCLLSLRNM